MTQTPNYVPIPITFPQTQEKETDAVDELMKKLFVRKVMKRFFDKKEEERDQDDLDDFFGLSDDDEKFAEMLFAGGTRNRFVSTFWSAEFRLNSVTNLYFNLKA